MVISGSLESVKGFQMRSFIESYRCVPCINAAGLYFDEETGAYETYQEETDDDIKAEIFDYLSEPSKGWLYADYVDLKA